MTSNNQLLNYGFYVVIILLAGAAAYLKIMPSDMFVPILTGLIGHAAGVKLTSPTPALASVAAPPAALVPFPPAGGPRA